jgi:serine protease SohB
MLDFLYQYGMFLAKSITIVMSFIIIIAVILSLRRSKDEEGSLLLYSVNEKYEDIRRTLQAETLPKALLKKWLKGVKQIAKTKKKSEKNNDTPAPRLFVMRFEGDVRASEVSQLREVISAIIEVVHPVDEVLLVLDSSGGFVHTYGLAASQLQRLRNQNIPLTVAIDKVAASGGYLMACVANHILAAPFAIVGSIGVMAQVPNFHRLLEKHNIDFEQQTAGEYKRTLTMFGKNTDKARKKFQQELDETHELFKNYIAINRPQVNVDEVATGEHWHALDALKFNLIDTLQTSDDFILDKMKTMEVFEISFEVKQRLSERLSHSLSIMIERIILKLSNGTTPLQ